LLSKAARLLKSGGILVYSTCSLEAEENTSVAQEFLRRHSEIKMVSAREVRPFAEAVDGGFVARFSSDASGVS
jgi:16S rRNA (cytosine967-C5)-methyltransferase